MTNSEFLSISENSFFLSHIARTQFFFPFYNHCFPHSFEDSSVISCIFLPMTLMGLTRLMAVWVFFFILRESPIFRLGINHLWNICMYFAPVFLLEEMTCVGVRGAGYVLSVRVCSHHKDQRAFPQLRNPLHSWGSDIDWQAFRDNKKDSRCAGRTYKTSLRIPPPR